MTAIEPFDTFINIFATKPKHTTQHQLTNLNSIQIYDDLFETFSMFTSVSSFIFLMLIYFHILLFLFVVAQTLTFGENGLRLIEIERNAIMLLMHNTD